MMTFKLGSLLLFTKVCYDIVISAKCETVTCNFALKKLLKSAFQSQSKMRSAKKGSMFRSLLSVASDGNENFVNDERFSQIDMQNISKCYEFYFRSPELPM